jgi:hypothetical protein
MPRIKKLTSKRRNKKGGQNCLTNISIYSYISNIYDEVYTQLSNKCNTCLINNNINCLGIIPYLNLFLQTFIAEYIFYITKNKDNANVGTYKLQKKNYYNNYLKSKINNNHFISICNILNDIDKDYNYNNLLINIAKILFKYNNDDYDFYLMIILKLIIKITINLDIYNRAELMKIDNLINIYLNANTPTSESIKIIYTEINNLVSNNPANLQNLPQLPVINEEDYDNKIYPNLKLKIDNIFKIENEVYNKFSDKKINNKNNLINSIPEKYIYLKTCLNNLNKYTPSLVSKNDHYNNIYIDSYNILYKCVVHYTLLIDNEETSNTLHKVEIILLFKCLQHICEIKLKYDTNNKIIPEIIGYIKNYFNSLKQNKNDNYHYDNIILFYRTIYIDNNKYNKIDIKLYLELLYQFEILQLIYRKHIYDHYKKDTANTSVEITPRFHEENYNNLIKLNLNIYYQIFLLNLLIKEESKNIHNATIISILKDKLDYQRKLKYSYDNLIETCNNLDDSIKPIKKCLTINDSIKKNIYQNYIILGVSYYDDVIIKIPSIKYESHYNKLIDKLSFIQNLYNSSTQNEKNIVLIFIGNMLRLLNNLNIPFAINKTEDIIKLLHIYNKEGKTQDDINILIRNLKKLNEQPSTISSTTPLTISSTISSIISSTTLPTISSHGSTTTQSTTPSNISSHGSTTTQSTTPSNISSHGSTTTQSTTPSNISSQSPSSSSTHSSTHSSTQSSTSLHEINNIFNNYKSNKYDISMINKSHLCNDFKKIIESFYKKNIDKKIKDLQVKLYNELITEGKLLNVRIIFNNKLLKYLIQSFTKLYDDNQSIYFNKLEYSYYLQVYHIIIEYNKFLSNLQGTQCINSNEIEPLIKNII